MNKKMKTYQIACDWSVYGIMFVKANTLEEAKKKVIEDEPIPTDSEYLDESFKINEEMTEELNAEEDNHIEILD